MEQKKDEHKNDEQKNNEQYKSESLDSDSSSNEATDSEQKKDEQKNDEQYRSESLDSASSSNEIRKPHTRRRLHQNEGIKEDHKPRPTDSRRDNHPKKPRGIRDSIPAPDLKSNEKWWMKRTPIVVLIVTVVALAAALFIFIFPCTTIQDYFLRVSQCGDSKTFLYSNPSVDAGEDSPTIGLLLRHRLTPILAEQHENFWDILDSELTYLISENNPEFKPTCLTMRVKSLPESSPESALECVNKHINYLLANKTGVLTLFGDSIRDMKSEFESDVTAHWRAGNKVTTIIDFNKMSYSSALLLYKLCDDNDEPAFPGTVILLSIEDDGSSLDDTAWLTAKLMQDWKDQSDQLNPLLTRIANNVVRFNSQLLQTC